MSSHLNFPYPHAGIGRPLAQRWCALAESRLDYLTELFESGRWRRFHSEAEFLDVVEGLLTVSELSLRTAAHHALVLSATRSDNHEDCRENEVGVTLSVNRG